MAVFCINREREGTGGSRRSRKNSPSRERYPGREAAICLREGVRAAPAAGGKGLAVRMVLLRAGIVAGFTVIVGQTMVTVYDRVPVQLLAPFAWIVKVKLPTAVGVPERTPAVVSVSPLGRAPVVTVKVYGLTPPLAVMVWL